MLVSLEIKLVGSRFCHHDSSPHCLVSFDHTCSFWNLLSIWSMLVQETLPLGCLLGWQWIVVLQAAVQRYIAACLQHLLSWSRNYANWSSSGCNSWLDWADWAGDVPTTWNFFFLYNKSLFTCCRLFRQCVSCTNKLWLVHYAFLRLQGRVYAGTSRAPPPSTVARRAAALD